MNTLNRDILKLAIPSIFANISIPLIGMVDMAVAGHLSSGATFIGALAIGTMLFDLLYWNFAFLRSGTGGLTAQAYGRGDKKVQAELFIRATGSGLVSGLILVAVQWLFLSLAFSIVKCSPEVGELAREYFRLRIWAAPATLSLMGFKGWFIGMQDSISPMLADILVLIVNAGASLALSFGFEPLGIKAMGFTGIAAGTVIAQYTALIFCTAIVISKYAKTFIGIRLKDVPGIFKGPDMRDYISHGGNLFLRSLCFMVVYAGYTTISARYGDIMLASSAIIMKIMMFFSYFTDGFAYAGEALVGRFIGAGETDRVRVTVKRIFIWSMSIALGFMVINALFPVPMLKVFTTDVHVVEASRRFIVWLVVMPLLGCPAFTWDGVYIGAAQTRALRDSSLLFVIAFSVTWLSCIVILNTFYALPPLSFGPEIGAEWPGNYAFAAMHVLFGAYMIHLLARVVYLTACSQKLIYRNFRSSSSIPR